MFYDDERRYDCTLDERCKFNVNIRAVVKGYEVLCRQQLYNSRNDHHHGRRLSDSMTTTALKPMATAPAMTPKPAPRNLLMNRMIAGAKDQSDQPLDRGLPISVRFVNIDGNLINNPDSQVSSNINKLTSYNDLQKQLAGQTRNKPTTNISGKSQHREQQQLQQQPQAQLNSEETLDSEHSSDDDTEDSVDARNRKAKVSL